MNPPLLQINNSPSISRNLSEEIVVESKLDHSPIKIEFDKSIALMVDYIREGEKNSSQIAGKNIIAFLGKTQAGKSTLVNCLYGSEVERKNAKDLGILAPPGKNLIVVKESAQEVMKIGHTKVSMTHMPQIVQAPFKGEEKIFFCDFPGFDDTRGEEINIANAANILQALNTAKSVRIVILTNIKSLETDRSKGFLDLIEICSDLFGSAKNFLEYKDSILLGITHIPLRDENEAVLGLEDLRELIRQSNSRDTEIFKALSERIFIYDPLENNDLAYSGGLQREILLEAVHSLTPILNPKSIFKLALNSSDKQKLQTISKKILDEIDTILNQEINIDYSRISDLFYLLKKIDIIDHRYISNLIDSIKKEIRSHFERKTHELKLSMEMSSIEDQRKAKRALSELKEALLYFDQDFQSEFSIDNLEVKLSNHFTHLDAENAAMDNGSFVKLFYEALTRYDFFQAQQLLNLLDEKHSHFVQKYASTGINSGINLEDLKDLFDRSKKTYDESRKKLDTQQRGIAIEQDRIQRNNDHILHQEMKLNQLERELEEQKHKTWLSVQALEEQKRKTEEVNRRLHEKEEAKRQADLLFLNQQISMKKAMKKLDQACCDKDMTAINEALEEVAQNIVITEDTLSKACRTRSLELVKILIIKGAKPDDRTLTWAFFSGNFQMVYAVAQAKGKPDSETLNAACSTKQLSLVKLAIVLGAKENQKTKKLVQDIGSKEIIQLLKNAKDNGKL